MNDKNNVAVVNTTDITHIINELRILDTRILNKLSSADGVIVQLSETITRLSGIKNMYTAYEMIANRSKIKIENSEKQISDNLQYLEETLLKLQAFELKHEQLLNQQFEKFKDFNVDLNAKVDLYQKEIISLKDSILSDLEKQINEIKNQINFKIVDIDIRNLEMINENANKAINNITAVANWTKNVYQINILLVAFLSFFGGGIFAFVIIYFLR